MILIIAQSRGGTIPAHTVISVIILGITSGLASRLIEAVPYKNLLMRHSASVCRLGGSTLRW